MANRGTIIIGGAIVGSMVAYFLRELGFDGRIVVLERDPSYRHSSTALSAASIRTQFACDVNVRMSLFGAAFLKSLTSRFGAEADVGFRERGLSNSGRARCAARA
jgi:FAD-dependent oxidoreductase domain-containing protein 1